MGGSSKTQTVGYRYYMGAHLVLWQGPIDRITEIRVGDRSAWTGDVMDGQVDIDKPELFGGEDREGGVSGRLDVMSGHSGQSPNGYLVNRIGGAVPAFRGVVSLVLRRMYMGVLPRFKPWAVTGQREPAGWTGAPSGLIGYDANPAHILYELITSTRWGLGYTDARVDTASFATAASTLASEDFGLSFDWKADSQTVQDFMLQVLSHIDGSCYLDPATGLWRLVLARGGYDVEALEVLDDTNVVDVGDFSRPSWGELVSEITVRYVDGDGANPSWTDKALTIQNLAVMDMQGGQPVNKTVDYPGVTKASLANRLASRDLRQMSSALARLELILTAEQQHIRPGDLRVLVWPDYGIESMVVRVADVNYGTVADGQVTVTAVEDVFGAVESEFATPTPTEWESPLNLPAAAPHRLLLEATYYDVARELGDNDSFIDSIDESAGYLITQAVRPSDDAFSYEAHVDAGGGYQLENTGNFCPTVELPEDIAPGQTVLPIGINVGTDLDLVEVGALAYLGDEILHVTAIDLLTGDLTVDRGVLDTVPAAHSTGERIIFGGFGSQSQIEYSDGETISVRMLPNTALGRLALVSAPTDQITFDARFYRPYPPGRIRVNGLDWPTEVTGAPQLDWRHRDRTLQTGPIITQDDGNVGPEPGVTYTLRIRDGLTNALKRTETGLSGISYSYTEELEEADGVLGHITWEIEAVRDGYTSWQTQRREAIKLVGYGRHYGENYGGM